MAREHETVTERVVQTVAAASNVGPLDLPPLYGAIDPDALEALVEQMAEGEVVFAYGGCEVTVDADGAVGVEETATYNTDSGTTAASN